jgi:hypothetical protein
MQSRNMKMPLAELAKGVVAVNDKPGGDGSNQYSNVYKNDNINKAKHGKGTSATYRIAKLKCDHHSALILRLTGFVSISKTWISV